MHFRESQSPYLDSIHYLYNLLIQVETKLSPFCIPQIQAHILVRKLLCFNSNVTNISSSQHYAINGPDNVLGPISQYAIIWTNDGLVYWRSARRLPQWVHSIVYVCCYPRLWHFCLGINALTYISRWQSLSWRQKETNSETPEHSIMRIEWSAVSARNIKWRINHFYENEGNVYLP